MQNAESNNNVAPDQFGEPVNSTYYYKTCLSEKTRVSTRIWLWLKRPWHHKIGSINSKGRKIFDRVEDVLFEKRHGLDCRGFILPTELKVDPTRSLSHSSAYEAVTCASMRTLINAAHKVGHRFDSFIDIGSGKGKACFYAAKRFNYAKVLGVEYSKELVEIAENNKRKINGNNICFVNCDALDFAFPPRASLVFLFNPFDAILLEEFLKKNISHFEEFGSVIAYVNDKNRATLSKLGFMEFYRNPQRGDSLYRLRRPGVL